METTRMRGIIIGALPPETPSVTRHVRHPNNFTPPGLTLSVSGAAPGFSIMGRKVLFVSRSAASVLRQLFGCIAEYTNTASRVRLLLSGAYYSVLYPHVGKEVWPL